MVSDNVILTDCDGVLCNWEWAFDIWMAEHGFKKVKGGEVTYNIGERYGIDKDQGRKLIKMFNESAAIGFLPPLRDAIHYVKKLHEEHGYIFHCITSLSKNRNSRKLRELNLSKLFGDTVFEEVICLGTGDDKDTVLEQYKDSGYYWIEDKVENAVTGLNLGLNPIIMEHGFNMDYTGPIPLAKNWAGIYNIITGR